MEKLGKPTAFFPPATLSLIPFSVSTDAASRKPTLASALTPSTCPVSSLSVLTFDPGIVMITRPPGWSSDASAMTRRSAALVTSA